MNERSKQSITELDVERRDLREVDAASQTFLVSEAVALDVERELGRVPLPGWIELEDSFGDRHRVLAWEVRGVREVTPARRTAWRRLVRIRFGR